ncbi:hypothetical protein [Haloarchaeobius sp. DYHT-AS-18]|uniref:hypothetical protein n=1 Tax=Haloarchaeobius sp. DYHT-AS-18 TaxID=3446117 RepID=UPI003EBC3791
MGETIRKAMMDPVGYVEQAADYKQYVALVENAEKLPGAMVQQYQQEMRVTNPYYDPQAQQVKHESNYKAFEKGYYAGVATFEVALSAAGGSGAATKFKKLKTVQKAASEPKVAKALSYYRKAQKAKAGAKVKYVTGPAAKTGYRLASGVSSRTGVDAEALHDMLGSVRTVGGQWRVTQRAQTVGLGKLNRVSETAREQVTRLLRRSDNKDIDDEMAEMSRDEIDAASRLSCSLPTPSILYKGSGVSNQLGPGDCTDEVSVARGAMKLSNDLTDDEFDQITKLDDPVEDAIAAAYDQDRGLDVNELKKLDEINSRHLESGDLDEAELGDLATRLAKSENPDQIVRFVNELDDSANVRRLLSEDIESTERMSRLFENRDADTGGIGDPSNGGILYRHVDSDLEASDIVDLSEKTNILEVRMVVKRDGRTTWLGNGDLEKGWVHIKESHIVGSYNLDEQGGTTMFPTGGTIRGKEIPSTLTDEDVKDLIYKAIKDGETTNPKGKVKYYFEPTDNGFPNSGIDDMRVIVTAEGAVKTSHPLSGKSVWKYVPGVGWISA